MKNKYIKHNNSWYSTVLALLLVGFMIIITTGIFNLVMSELKDTSGMSHYFKAYAWVEAGIELWLLDIKNWSDLVNIDKNDPKSDILDSKTKVVYNFDWYSWEITKTWIWPWDYALVELLDAKNPTLTATDNIIWNIVWEESGITWEWFSFNPSTAWNRKTLNSVNNFDFFTETINNFLNNSDWNYLIVFNPNLIDIDFTLAVGAWERIMKDTVRLKSSWFSSKYKQNLILEIDKSWYLNFLKYSIFSQ